MQLHIRDAWFSARTLVRVDAGDDRLVFERCTFHGGEVRVGVEIDRTIFVGCLFQGTSFTAQSLSPRISADCQWQPPNTEESMVSR